MDLLEQIDAIEARCASIEYLVTGVIVALGIWALSWLLVELSKASTAKRRHEELMRQLRIPDAQSVPHRRGAVINPSIRHREASEPISPPIV